jgi:FixJ family two-component response regulator
MRPAQALIAVVDDEEAVRTALSRLLRSAGYATDNFLSGEEFLGSLEIRSPDCVVLDLRMPTLSGHQVQARLAAAGRRIPVVVLTGYDSPDARERALQAGAMAFLRKPVDDSELLGAINAALGRR